MAKVRTVVAQIEAKISQVKVKKYLCANSKSKKAVLRGHFSQLFFYFIFANDKIILPNICLVEHKLKNQRELKKLALSTVAYIIDD